MNLFENIKLYTEAIRVRQWTKNLLVFAAPLFAFQIEYQSIINASKGFISFCLISSSIYLINDILDISSDKNHPTKSLRPIARGSISIKSSYLLALFLVTIGILIATSISLSFLLIILTYIVIQLAYCKLLKRKPLLDIFCISSGFILRAIGGVIASDLGYSPWFILTVGLLALFLAIEKRKAELRLIEKNNIQTRIVLKRYSLPLLLRLESLVGTSAFMSYSLWAAGPSLNGASTSLMLLSVPFVIAGIFRYQLISDPEEALRRMKYFPDISCESPEEILMQDNGIKLTVVSWLTCVIFIGIIDKIYSLNY